MSRLIPVHSTPSYPPLTIYWSGVSRSYGLPLFAVVKPRPMATRALRITLVRTSNWSGHFAGLARSGLIPSASRTITAARFSSVGNHARMATISSGVTGGFFRLSCRVPTSGTMGHKFCRRYSVMREFGTEPPNSPLLLTSEEIEANLKKLHISSWWIGEDVAKSKNKSTGQVVEKKVKTLFTRLKFKKYSDGLELVRRVGEVAERVDHHPTITLAPRTLSISVYTHAASVASTDGNGVRKKTSGVTVRDLEFVELVEKTFEDMKETRQIETVQQSNST